MWSTHPCLIHFSGPLLFIRHSPSSSVPRDSQAYQPTTPSSKLTPSHVIPSRRQQTQGSPWLPSLAFIRVNVIATSFHQSFPDIYLGMQPYHTTRTMPCLARPLKPQGTCPEHFRSHLLPTSFTRTSLRSASSVRNSSESAHAILCWYWFHRHTETKETHPSLRMDP